MGILDLLFPKYCINCKTFGEYICANCFSLISLETMPICGMCGNATINALTHPVCKTALGIDGIFCGVLYKGTIKKLVYKSKYTPYVFDLTKMMASLFIESLIQQESFTHILQKLRPVLVPIPLHAKKEKKRGYNQSALLANYLSKNFQLPTSSILLRTKETKPQFGLNKEQRQENMLNAFAVKQKPLFKEVFVVDDILTTGATLKEAAKILKRNGVEKVWGVCFSQDL